MKRILLIGTVLLSYGSIAQTTIVEQDCEATISSRPAAKPMADNSGTRAIPFWTEDFGGGYPAGWTNIDTSGICPWVYSTDGSWGNFNGNGATAGATPINSTTGANGFLLCDIDSANHFTYGQPSGANYQYLATHVQTAAINCSGHSSVILSFEQFYRYNNGVAMIVQVSNDGLSWTSYNVSNGLANNATSANPATVTLNISATAANQANVFIRFGWSARVYYWMVDDISLREADPNDLGVLDSWWGMGGFNYQHYKIPLSHAAPITFFSDLTNLTGASLTGCATTIDVTGTSGSVFSGITNALTIGASLNDTVTSTTTWTPSVVGMYDVAFEAQTTSGTDGNLTNNSFADSVQITNSVFGLDNLTSASQSTGSISNFSSNTGSPFKIGNIYQVTVNDVVECIQIGIANNAQNGGKEIFAEVYAYDPVNAEFVNRGATFFHTITTAEVGTIISLEMAVPADVFADEEILVVAGHSGGLPAGTDDVSFMYGQSVPEQMVYGYDGAGGLFFLASPRAIVVRPDFNCGLGIDEASNTINATVYPNPAADQFTIQFENELNEASVTLTDLNGRIVYQQAISSMVHEFSIETANLANGMYTLRVQSENGVKTLQVEVAH